MKEAMELSRMMSHFELSPNELIAACYGCEMSKRQESHIPQGDMLVADGAQRLSPVRAKSDHTTAPVPEEFYRHRDFALPKETREL